MPHSNPPWRMTKVLPGYGYNTIPTMNYTALSLTLTATMAIKKTH